MSFVIYSVPSLNSTSERARIDSAIARGDSYELGRLAYNENCNANDLLKIEKLFPEENVWAITAHANVPQSILDQYMVSKNETTRVHAICSAKTPAEVLHKAVMFGDFAVKNNTWSKAALKKFANRGGEKYFHSYEAFEKLWNDAPKDRDNLISGINLVLLRALRAKKTLNIDPRFAALMSKDIHEQDKKTRESYARSRLVDPEVLDTMKDDPNREVIKNIARNEFALSSTHEYLATKHKTASIRESIAWTTKDNVLLNKIYNSTKSESIRKYVTDNPEFLLL